MNKSTMMTIAAGVLIAASWLTGWDWLMLAAAAVAGYKIAISAFNALKVRSISIDLLVVVAAVGAIIIDNYWEAAAVTFLFSLGKTLEAATLAKTRKALSDLVDQAPETATVLNEDGTTQTVELWELAARDPQDVIVVVKNGEQVPVDGRVIAGHGGVDEASITGESIPAEKLDGDEVYAGTWLRSGLLRVQATAIGADSTLAKIIHRVEDAQDDKARTQTFLEKFSTYYTPSVMIAAVLAALLTRDIELALTLLVIGCPGALVISIPVSIVAGIGRSARDGVLIKGGEHLEQAARVDVVVVDKTGTVTHGKPVLTDVDILDPAFDREDILYLAASAESGSQHPLASAIIDAAADYTPVTDIDTITGQGIRARVDAHVVTVGTAELVGAGELAETNGMYVGVDGKPVARLEVVDTIREDARVGIAKLHDAGIKVVMATGDAQDVAEDIGGQLGIDEIHARQLPEDKLNLVADLQRRGHTVAMLGDGVNDTPALAQADIGVAMGAAGSPAAIETADIALMADRLTRLPHALRLARRTVRTMRVNIAIALITVSLLLAGVLLGGVTMAIGMLVHEASVLLVIGIAMLLLRPTLDKKAEHALAAGPDSAAPREPQREPQGSAADTTAVA